MSETGNKISVDRSLREFLKSEFMKALLEEYKENKAELSLLMCEHLSKGHRGKKMGAELIRAYEDAMRKDLHLEMLQDFKRNYLANKKKPFAKNRK